MDAQRNQLVADVAGGNRDSAVSLVKEIIENTDPKVVLDDLTAGMKELGRQFEAFEIFLPEMLMAAQAFMAVTDILEPVLMSKGEAVKKTKVVLATVKGDIHEIGKNIVGIVLKCSGFEVIDLGKDVDPLDIVNAAKQNDAKIIGLSALMTTTMPAQKEFINILKDLGVRDRFKVIVGGPSITREWTEEIGADGFADDAFMAVPLIQEIAVQAAG